MQPLSRVLIAGGGFGGVRAALDLARNPAFSVTLISKNKNFEYYPGLHKMLGVSEYAPVSIPLATLFKNTKVSVIIDTVTSIDPEQKKVSGTAGEYAGDFLVLALGGQTEYFNISGLAELAYGFKSVADAQKLRNHVEEVFKKHTKTDKTETLVGLHMVVVGAGPNGVDLAGELACLDRSLAKKYGIAESLVTVDLIEAGPRILGMMPESVSSRVEKRLRELGIHVFCNRDLREQESWTVMLADMEIGARTLVWTAGVAINTVIAQVKAFTFGKKGRVVVDNHLQAVGFSNVFCIGDIADTQYAGLAQTALADGAYVAKYIAGSATKKAAPCYAAKGIAYNIGVGPRWSVLVMGKFAWYGIAPYILRTLIDIKFFLSILPVREVWKLYFSR
jgi:NADH dehydrogenase